jgi:trimethylamine:corrinoid methyltransferase-like protein
MQLDMRLEDRAWRGDGYTVGNAGDVVEMPRDRASEVRTAVKSFGFYSRNQGVTLHSPSLGDLRIRYMQE